MIDPVLAGSWPGRRRFGMKDIPFICSSFDPAPFPLAAYLPAHRPGSTTDLLSRLSLDGKLLLTPFGGSPQAILEAAQAGYRVLVPAHNPILRLLLQGLAHPLPREEMNSELARLASSLKGETRIKPLLLALYETECPRCGGPATARSFTWSRSQAQPILKTCRCSACGEDTQGPVNAADLARAAEFKDNSPSHARALTRVSPPDDPLRFQVEIALRSYPPRAVYALQTLFNKISGQELEGTDQLHLEMLLLHAFYRSSSPETRMQAERQKESDQKDLYREENVWYAMEAAADFWCREGLEIPLSSFPGLPPDEGGITLFPGRVRDLIPHLADLDLGAVMLVFPRPSLSFWALSALWTGWLWGQEAAAPLRGILSVRSYDWAWISQAVETTLAELKRALPGETPFLGLLPDLNPDYLLASISAGCQAGLYLDGIAIDPDLALGITTWSPEGSPTAEPADQNDRKIIREAGLQALKAAGEPKHTLSLYGAGLVELTHLGSLRQPVPDRVPEVFLPRLQQDFDENIAYRQGFLHYSQIECWWHQDLSLSSNPQSDQVEQALVRLLIEAPSPLTEDEIYQQLYQIFPGIMTPQHSLIQACLRSYAQKVSATPPQWSLKENEGPAQRKKDLEEIERVLHQIGKDLGFTVSSQPALGGVLHLTWHTEITQHYNFFVSASGLLNKILLHFPQPPRNPWIILPGSRAGLIQYKLGQNPPLEGQIKDRYGLMKFRHIRRLADDEGLTHSNLQERLALDPFRSESPQLPLF